MKNFIKLIAILISVNSYSQVEFGTTTEVRDTGFKINSGTYQVLDKYVVIESEGTAAELYEKTIGWINETYNTPSEVIKGQVEGDYIRIEGSSSTPLFFYRALGQTMGYDGYRYSIEIRFKDGKVRFEPTKLEVYQAPNASAYVAGGWFTVLFEGRLKNKKGKDDKAGVKTANAQRDYFSSLATRLDTYYKKGSSGGSTDDDW